MHVHYAILTLNWDIYVDPIYTKVHYVPLDSQKKKLAFTKKRRRGHQRASTQPTSVNTNIRNIEEAV